MEKVERICSNCSTANAYDRTHCSRCGTNLTTLPVPRGSSLPARVRGPSAAALLVGASVFIARVGFRLFARQILPRAAQALKQAALSKPESPPKSITKDRPAMDAEPNYVIRGWRAWSVRRGAQHSQGSETFEWRIDKKR